ncbi:MAG: hypothetical protein COT25_02355 [Candidatus Kerfeldbacteria bacterium CG08_land_8_20_14_0_20_42_7]|uniref:SHS2 domain-containing protein n=1 Tax=Candidatus Kerfeldbacteria bacterium CG08_land_8_20_14_0_20_42_7 TaxID=2014245 RepID=A0A2H0YSV7_9BACT|nr:MAG: hypothetical protein COT25_02355 [Candidatus Kerfeldbacteria bacterium CG08_land_8_20_14_0_20_42_7]
MKIFNPFDRAHGVDISDFMMRLVEARTTKKGIEIFAFHEVPIDPGIIQEGEIKNYAKAKEQLERLYKKINGRVNSPFAIVAVPERKTFTKVVQMDALPPAELAEAIRWEAEQHFPVSLEEMYLTWSLLQTSEKKHTILLSATDKSLLEQYIELFADVQKHIIIAEPESFAIQRALLGQSTIPTLIIDLGASKTSLAIVSRGIVQYTSTISFSGRELTLLIAKELNLKEEQAERAKTLFGLNPKKSKGVVRDLLIDKFSPLVQHINEVLQYYQTNFDQSQPIQKIVLCGGGSQMEGIHTFLSETLRLEINNPIPLINKNKKMGSKFTEKKVLSFTTALGLALRSELQKPFQMLSKTV